MSVSILTGDCRAVLATLPAGEFHTCISSPPYFGLRAYLPEGHPDKAKEVGTEPTPDEFVAALVAVFREVRRVLRDDGTVWLNLGDSYNGGGVGGGGRGTLDGASNRDRQGEDRATLRVRSLKPKDLIGIPWMVAFALRADGWYLRQDIIWAKPNPMPESVRDRCTKSHEYLFLLSKRPSYYFDAKAIAEKALQPPGDPRDASGVGTGHKQAVLGQNKGGYLGANSGAETRNKRSVWTVATQSFPGSHFATFPPALIEPCILAGCPVGGNVLDPFGGAGTTGLVADRLQRNATLIELNPAYAAMARSRITDDAPLFVEAANA